VALLLLGLGLVCVRVAIAKKLMYPRITLLPSAIFLTVVSGNSLDVTHRWYSLSTATTAVAALMERRTPSRVTVAGFLCGQAAQFGSRHRQLLPSPIA
jgi:hypothetical protein